MDYGQALRYKLLEARRACCDALGVLPDRTEQQRQTRKEIANRIAMIDGVLEYAEANAEEYNQIPG